MKTAPLASIGALLLFFICNPLVQASLPGGWTDQDIGSPGLAGSASDVNGDWTVAGGGSDIWNAADQFNFASTTDISDGSIIAEVTSLQNSDPSSGWSKAGVMFRNDTTAGSPNVAVVIADTQGVNLQWRSSESAQCSNIQITGVSAPIWLQLNRSGDNFTGYYSYDGINWLLIGTTQIAMKGSVLAGAAVTAHNNSALNTAVFTNVSLSSQAFGVYRQLWTNLNENIGDTLAMLTNTAYNPKWPNNPSAASTHVFTNFETELDTGTNYYGQSLQTFVIPPTTGYYTFWIASDDTSLLSLSSNESPANAAPIASVTSYTTWRDFTEEASQQSSPIYLQGGLRYYLEALMQQGTGADNLSVQWQLPNGTVETPLGTPSAAGTLLIPFTGLTNFPGIYLSPTNTTAVEDHNVTFSLSVTNQSSVSYQWHMGATNLPGAIAPVLTLTNLSINLNGQFVSCVVSNALGSVTSAPVLLTVVRDTNPPTVVQALNIGMTNVEIVYSKPINASSATNIGNYAFTNNLAITAASLDADSETVILTTAPLVYGSNYSIVINGITDLASIPNMIAANTTVNFNASPYLPYDIGNPSTESTVNYTTNSLEITTESGNFGGTTDQGNLSYQVYSGNFDVSVRVASLGLSEIFAQAGLMARESLTNNGRFAASFATPAMNGSFFEWRATVGGLTSTAGNFPANYPNTWLRLQRVGNTFAGYAGYDGQTWTELGSQTIAMSNQVYLGFAVSSDNTNEATTAQFQNFANTSNAIIGTQINPHDAMGPSSRKTPIAFSEIMWKPAPRSDGKNLEFLEIYNSNPWFQDISSYQITCADMNYTFPAGTTIPGGGYLVIAAAPADITSVYGITNVMGPYTGSLKHSETLELLDEETNVLLTVPYSDVYPWPVATDGTGHSMVLSNPTYGEGDPRAWDISDVVGGSPGQMDGFTPSPLRNVLINEILPHSENPAVPQFIELYNHSTNTVNISGCILTDDPTTNKFIIPQGTTIGPAGFISFTQFGFTLNGEGETLYFIKPDGSRVLDAVQFGAQADGVSYGRCPDGANDFYAFATNTQGTNNGSILIGDIVINELMYDPISGNDDDQYIELYNKGTNTISLSGWQFTSGVTFTFPTNAIIGPGAYVVVGRNTANLFSKYSNLNSGNTYGNYSGKLSHDGELVVLAQPESFFGTNTIYVEEDEVTYGTGGRWGEWSSGGGSSMELIDPHANHRLAANWADSDDTSKSVWTNITYTGVLDNGDNYDPTIDYAQIGVLEGGMPG
jgi:regulation of enolase protein 1 (concanavalin A-like superfamily)